MVNQVQKAERRRSSRSEKTRNVWPTKKAGVGKYWMWYSLENCIAVIEEKCRPMALTFGKLATLQKELEEKNEAILKNTSYEYLSEFDS